jgi:hypothetical protein
MPTVSLKSYNATLAEFLWQAVFNTKLKQKIKFFRLKMMCQWASYRKKNMRKRFFVSLNSVKKGVDRLDPELDPDPDPLVRDTDPGIRIRGSGSVSAPKCHGSSTLVARTPLPNLLWGELLSLNTFGKDSPI